jgi:hypothetical protein
MSDAPGNTPHGDPLATKATAGKVAKAAASKAAKADWNAAPPFPVASNSSVWSEAIAAATASGSTRSAALALARHGVPVFPVSPQKKPLNGHGVYSATIDLAVVDRDFSRYPNALIGVPMGRRTGVFAIDTDAKPPHAHDGIAAWRALVVESGASPAPTRVHLTASGGQHFIYLWRDDRPIGCPVKGLPLGIECKGEGGAIVFPPSRREGKPYLVVDDRPPADAPSWLLDLLAAKQAPRPKVAPSSRRTYERGEGSPYGLKALENGCAKLRHAGPGERDRTIGKTVPALGSLAAGGEIDPVHAVTELKAAGRAAVGDDSLDDKIERAFERGAESPRGAPKRGTAGRTGGITLLPADEKPRLKIDRSHPQSTVTELRDILAVSGRLYERGTPVRVVFDRTLEGSVAHSMTADSLTLEAHFSCQPYALVKERGGWVECDAPLPTQMARMYLGWRGEWNLPPLNGIATTPLLSEDGSIRTARGYDGGTGLWCERVPDIGGLVPLKPARSEAEAALTLIRDAFKTFCFADAETIAERGVSIVDLRKPPGLDESSFLASLLGSVCRPCLWLAPGSTFRAAPHSGSGAGKGKLVRCICALAYERQPSAVTAGGSPEEMEKRISAALLEGGPAVLFDNFNNVTLRSASLESALTERPAKVRQFRTLDLITLNSVASVFVTGNGILLAQDIVRRFIPTEFDAHMEDPERRSFSGDIVAEITRRRPELLAALLTIWRYGRLAGDIKPGRMLGSYERWCSWVRDPLLTLGCRDPVERLSEAKRRDPSRQTNAALFDAWWRHHESSPQRGHQLDIEVQRIIDPQGRGRQYVAVQLEKLDGTRLAGFVLTRQRGLGLSSVATYALQKTGDQNFTSPADGTDDADAFPLGATKSASSSEDIDDCPNAKTPGQNGEHRHHADHHSGMWNIPPDRDGLL